MRKTVHELKTWPVYFSAVIEGRKTFEIRKDDRLFTEGDTLHLREWDPETREYTGFEVYAIVTYILKHSDFPGIAEGYVVLGIRDHASLGPIGMLRYRRFHEGLKILKKQGVVPVFGGSKGLFEMSADFDEPMDLSDVETG